MLLIFGSSGVIWIFPGVLMRSTEPGSFCFREEGFCSPMGCRAVIVNGPRIPMLFFHCSLSFCISSSPLEFSVSSFSPLKSFEFCSSLSVSKIPLFSLARGSSSMVLPSSSSSSSEFPEFSSSSSTLDLSSRFSTNSWSSLTGLAFVIARKHKKTINTVTDFILVSLCLRRYNSSSANFA